MTRPQAGSLPLCFAQVLQHATHKTASNVVQRMLEHADVSRHLDLAKKLPRNHVYIYILRYIPDLPPTYPNVLSFFSKMSTPDQQTDDGLKRSSTSDCAPNGTIHGGVPVSSLDLLQLTEARCQAASCKLVLNWWMNR